MPEQYWRWADDPAYSMKRRYPSSSVMGCSSETAVGQVPAAASTSPSPATRSFASFLSSASSPTASSTDSQIPVLSSTTEAKSSGLIRGGANASGGKGTGSSVSASSTNSSSSIPMDQGGLCPNACSITAGA